MEINITCSDYEKRFKLQEVVKTIKTQEGEIGLVDSQLFLDYPIFQDYENTVIFPTICIISPKKGIILLFLNELGRGSEIEDIIKKADQTLNQIFALLIKSSKLRLSRQSLKVTITSFVLSDYIDEREEIISYAKECGVILTSIPADIMSKINELPSKEIDDYVFAEMCSIIEGIKSIQKQKTRNIPDGYENSKGALLEKISDQINIFDRNQRIAALCCIDGPQRIRGLAGSGKTIILAIKTAIYHLRYPERKILYTFWTKSLYDQVKLLVSKFYRLYSSNDPNWEMVNIKHAWGGYNLAGVYYDTCLSNGVSPLSLKDAQKNGRKGKEFEFVCEQLLESTKGNLNKEYDLILIDEGQDFSAPFYWLCRKLVKNDSLVWAYDELQNVLNVKMQNSIDLFKNKYGDEGIDLIALSNDFYKNDLVLDVCYRNPLEILMVAHGLGFGIYNETILQMLENAEHWSDLGYMIINGECQRNKDVTIERPQKNSPSLMSLTQKELKLIEVNIFDTIYYEIEYVVNEVSNNIKNDYLLPEDIMIICLDDRNSKAYFDMIEVKLSDCGIQVNNIVNSFTGDHFFVKGAITLTTVYRAKGNEAGMVYIVGTDAYNFLFSRDDINVRNKLFTAITRTKAWVRITASKPMEWISKEITTIMSNIPYFKFKYPDLDQIKMLRRELTDDAEKKNKNLKLLMEQIASMDMSQEDIISYLIKNASYGKIDKS